MNLMEARHITVSVGDTPILKDCSLSIGPGEFVGIIGPNGAGKSTFLKACRKLIDRSGTVSLLGKPETALKEKDIARIIAFMQQDFHAAFGYSCEEIVLSARYPYLSWWQGESQKDKDIARKCMEFTGVSHLAKKDIQSVSGGERQRVLLAKVLAQEAPLLFLDEPTAALDLLYQEEIFRLCASLARDGKSILMICHDLMMAARWASRLILIAHGHIMADGTPEEVLTESNLSDAFGLHSIVYTNPISGALDLYTCPKPKPKEKTVLLLGSNLQTASLIRHLYANGYKTYCGYLPATTITREVAKDFHVPYLETTARIPQQADIMLAYGLTDTERKRYAPLLSQGTLFYTDQPSPGARQVPMESLIQMIRSGTL